MKLVMTLLVRDEADIVDAQIAFHLHAGVDFVIATDNRSQDGTTEILERYERAGVLHLIREPGDEMRQSEWVTRMARLAATDFGADWVLNTDADEFWWPRGGSLKDVLETVPERYGVVRGCWRHFLPRPEDGRVLRRADDRAPAASPRSPATRRRSSTPTRRWPIAPDPNVTVEAGNHNALGAGLDPIRAWHPIEVLHFSFRSVSQLERKGRGRLAADRGLRADAASVPARRGTSRRAAGGLLRVVRRRPTRRSSEESRDGTPRGRHTAQRRAPDASRRGRSVSASRSGRPEPAVVPAPGRSRGRAVRGRGGGARRHRRRRPSRAARRRVRGAAGVRSSEGRLSRLRHRLARR